MKEAKTQEKFNELSKLGEWFCVKRGYWETLELSHVVARGQSHVEAGEQSHVVAGEQSHVVARGQSHVEARGQSHVEAGEQSHVVAISPYVSILAESKDTLLTGGYILGNKVLTAKEWLSACNVTIKSGKVILYKRIDEDWTSQKGVSYTIGGITTAPDWDVTSKDECGKGLHFCPTPAQTNIFRENGIYIACEVFVKDIASLPAFAECPDKIRARACKVLYQVDENGNKL